MARYVKELVERVKRVFPHGERAKRSRRIVAITIVFVVALFVRFLYATDAVAALYGVEQDRYRIAFFYHEAAASLAEGDDRVVFPSGISPEDTLLVGYPPGYFVVMGGVYWLTGNSMAAMLVLQCLLDALACVVLLLIGEALFTTSVGTIAGSIMALSPQFAHLTLVLKPDTMVVLLVECALLFVIWAVQKRRLRDWILAGCILGVACWLRQNALLLAPVLGVGALLWPGWKQRLRPVAIMLGVCALIVLPLTVRNYVLYGETIPVTIGSGFALLSGLSRDDYANRYDLPRFGYNFSIDEARERGLPDDYFIAEYDRLQRSHRRQYEIKHTVLSVFAVDGIERDRERQAKALSLIASDPIYFSSIYWLRIERLLGFTQQLRAVPQSVGDAETNARTRGFYETLDPSLGGLRYTWDQGHLYDLARPLVGWLQRFYVTPVVLLFALCGFAMTALWGWRTAAFLVLPVLYYLGLQALMWAEFRHTLPVHVSLFLFCAVAIVLGWRVLLRTVERLTTRPAE